MCVAERCTEAEAKVEELSKKVHDLETLRRKMHNTIQVGSTVFSKAD